MKSIIKVFVIYLTIFSPVFANDKAKNAFFTIKAAKGEALPDSIQAVFFKGIVLTEGDFRVGLKVKKHKDGSFTFDVPCEQPLTPIWLNIWYPGGDCRSTNIYFAQQSDVIDIELKMITDKVMSKYWPDIKTIELSFDGKESLKYTVVNRMNEIIKDNHNSTYTRYFETFNFNSRDKERAKDDYRDFTRYLHEFYNDCLFSSNRLQDTLSKYKDQLKPELVSFFKVEYNRFGNQFARSLHALSESVKVTDKQELIDFYFSKMPSLNFESETDLFKYGPVYRLIRSENLMVELSLKNKGNTFPFSAQYEEIKKVNNTELRDIMIAILFKNERITRLVSDFSDRDSCLANAIKLVTNPEISAILNDDLKFSVGKDMDDFSFVDLDGKTVSLADMKGNVFILDFYFAGCVSCSVFAKRFEHEVLPEFSKNPSFKVLSVSGDAKRDQWIKALKSGDYTHPNSVNLNTGGFNHPLFKKYKISTFPWVILVDKNGKVLSYHVQAMTSSEIKELIRSALKG